MNNSHSGSHTDPKPQHETMPNQNDEARPDIPRCFVAYPSSLADHAESIETAIRDIHAGGVVDIIGWTSLAVSGRIVIGAICDEIKSRQIFCAPNLYPVASGFNWPQPPTNQQPNSCDDSMQKNW